MEERDWKSIEYLKDGNVQQRDSFNILQILNVFEQLNIYQPILVGTIPIEIDTPISDLDIICEVYDFPAFQETIRAFYANQDQFSDLINADHYVAHFFYQKRKIEIYAAPQPTDEQMGYRHMLIEYRILQLLGTSFKQKIIDLKCYGYKTEPAFGKVLGLEGDVYQNLLDMESLTDDELLKRYSGTY